MLSAEEINNQATSYENSYSYLLIICCGGEKKKQDGKRSLTTFLNSITTYDKFTERRMEWSDFFASRWATTATQKSSLGIPSLHPLCSVLSGDRMIVKAARLRGGCQPTQMTVALVLPDWCWPSQIRCPWAEIKFRNSIRLQSIIYLDQGGGVFFIFLFFITGIDLSPCLSTGPHYDNPCLFRVS